MTTFNRIQFLADMKQMALAYPDKIIMMDDIDRQLELTFDNTEALYKLDKITETRIQFKRDKSVVFNPSKKQLARIMEIWRNYKQLFIPVAEDEKDLMARCIAGRYIACRDNRKDNTVTLAVVPLLFAHEIQEAYDNKNMHRLGLLYKEFEAWEELVEKVSKQAELLLNN